MDAQEQANLTLEGELVVRARSGDTTAFSELVRLFQRRSVSVAYRLLNNSEDASDVAQDAFVKAYRSLDQLENPERFGPWLMRIVSNLALNFRRSRKANSAASLDEDLLGAGEGIQAGTGRKWASGSADDGPLSDEMHSAISNALEKLPEKQRLALILFSVEGMPQSEVAEILDCKIGLVKWNVFQARKTLKELLADML